MQKKHEKRIKLSEETISKIRQLRADGLKGEEIARKFNVSSSVIYKYTSSYRGEFSTEKIRALLIKNKFIAARAAKEINVVRGRMSQIIRAVGLTEWVKKEKNAFQQEIPNKIIDMYKNGKTIDEIAEHTGKSIVMTASIINHFKRSNGG